MNHQTGNQSKPGHRHLSNILCGKSEFLTAEMIVNTSLTCVDWPGLFRTEDAEVWVTEGPDPSTTCFRLVAKTF